MAVIITDMDMPKHCSECPIVCLAHYDGDMSKCKIRSVDGLIKKLIKEECNTGDPSIAYGLGRAVTILKNHIGGEK